jgi:hypothetical protein
MAYVGKVGEFVLPKINRTDTSALGLCNYKRKLPRETENSSDGNCKA